MINFNPVAIRLSLKRLVVEQNGYHYRQLLFQIEQIY